LQWNKLCKLKKFRERGHHRSLITYDDLDYNFLNENDLFVQSIQSSKSQLNTHNSIRENKIDKLGRNMEKKDEN